MADDSGATGPGPFDVGTVGELVRLMAEHDLAEIDLREGNRRISLRRGGPTPQYSPAPMPSPQQVFAPAPSQPAPASNGVPAAPPGKKLLEIKSPTVGTFYTRPAPDKDDFVKIGSRVEAETVVCTIEAMKIFNPIAAGVSGVITEILIANGQFVEFDQVIFRVDPLG